MDLEKSKEKKFDSVKKLIRSMSIIRRRKYTTPEEAAALSKSKSCSHATAAAVEKEKPRHAVAPGGCFSVYVGPEKQRFVVKMRFLSHPLFKMLLEDAELEYGFCNEGPILLPCDVDLFNNVLAEMEGTNEMVQSRNIGFGYGNCSPFKGYASYGHLKMNQS